jgi:hypothetical protein
VLTQWSWVNPVMTIPRGSSWVYPSQVTSSPKDSYPYDSMNAFCNHYQINTLLYLRGITLFADGERLRGRWWLSPCERGGPRMHRGGLRDPAPAAGGLLPSLSWLPTWTGRGSVPSSRPGACPCSLLALAVPGTTSARQSIWNPGQGVQTGGVGGAGSEL